MDWGKNTALITEARSRDMQRLSWARPRNRNIVVDIADSGVQLLSPHNSNQLPLFWALYIRFLYLVSKSTK